MRTLLTVLALVAVGLAGCAGDEAPGATPTIDPESFELAAGTGAIAGLLVDDRFRPIQLTDDPQTEFQAEGFVLLQETGEQVQTTENGEFVFIDLEPATYTVRVTAAGHEATPAKVQVQEGVFNEMSVVARRVDSLGSFIVTQEKSMFTECAAEAVVIASAWLPCSADLSLDGARTDIQADYVQFKDDATAFVTEASFNNPGDYDFTVRILDEATGGIGAQNMADCEVRGGDYVRIQMIPGEVHECGRNNIPFSFNQSFQTIMFAWSATHTTAETAYDTAIAPVADCEEGVLAGQTGCRNGIFGAGVVLAVRAQVIESVFLGEPEVDLDAYCVLC